MAALLIKLYLQKWTTGQIWLTGCRLLTSDLDPLPRPARASLVAQRFKRLPAIQET